MVGRIIVTADGSGRKPTLCRETVCGLSLMAATLSLGDKPRTALRRTRRAARLMAEEGVRRVLTPPDFPCWAALAEWGLEPVDAAPFLQAQARPLALGALARAGIPREEATVALRTGRVTRPFYQAAFDLCAAARYLVIDALSGGEELTAYLRREYGVAVLPPEAPAAVTLHFAPREDRGEERALRLYGPVYEMDGMGLNAPNLSIPMDCDPLPLLALLWEEGRLPGEPLVVFDGETS